METAGRWQEQARRVEEVDPQLWVLQPVDRLEEVEEQEHPVQVPEQRHLPLASHWRAG